MAELADAPDLGSGVLVRGSSSLFTRTTSEQSALCSDFLFQRKSSARFLAPPFPQKVTFASANGL